MIKVFVPATSANCCVGFDCLGLALDWYAEFRFEKSDALIITGCDKEFQTKDNLVVQAFEKTCQYLKKELPTFALDIRTRIPFQRGLGSSSTCIVAGILAANAWFDAGLSKDVMDDIATEMEGHPDNVTPAIFGALSVGYYTDKVYKTTFTCADWNGLAMIPSYPVETREARKILPESIPLAQASRQVAHAIQFAQALESGDEQALFDNATDYLHEPYRKNLIQDYEVIHNYCVEHKIAMWISGSGSTMMALSMNKETIKALKMWIQDNFDIQTEEVKISNKGAWVEYE